MTNHCFTLAYNLPSEVEKVTKLLYELNPITTFKHLIVDLGFPLEKGDRIPKDIEMAKLFNSSKLKDIATKYGSDYARMPNIGVSQNWTQVYEYLKPLDSDILIGCDPDEHPKKKGWVRAMGQVIREKNLALCSLMMVDHVPLIAKMPHGEHNVAGHRIYYVANSSLNWALIGVSGKFLNLIKEIPYPLEAPIYGWIEAMLYPSMTYHGMNWCILADYMVEHTDYQHGHPGTSSLLREWKNQIVYKVSEGQMLFDEFLVMKREGTL